MQEQKSIAVIGGGVAGVVSAYLLSERHSVSLFEANSYLGGHTNTHQLTEGPDAGLGIDTGFIVLNDKNYPLLHRFLARLGVATRYSDMSFSYYDQQRQFQYAGTTLNGLFAQRSNLVSANFWKFLYSLYKFCATAVEDLANGLDRLTLGEYLRMRNTPQALIDDYLLPMGAAIWSAPLEQILAFPAESFLRFFKHHGLLTLRNRPQWQTVVGGSSAYMKAFQGQFSGSIHLEQPAQRITRKENHIEIQFKDGTQAKFDAVVLACHADQSLALLADPSSEETRLLGAWKYQANHAIVHNDISVLPSHRRAWASWNYVRFRSSNGEPHVRVSYWMNNLQGLPTDIPYIVSLNCADKIDPDKCIAEYHYTHPVFSQAAIDTQGELSHLHHNNTYFCGSYFGYGFHEDAVRSAVAVAEQWGIQL